MAKIITTSGYPRPAPPAPPARLPVQRTAQQGSLEKRVEALEVAYSALPLDKLNATTDPVVTDDEGDGYEIGSRWLNLVTDREFVCLDASEGFAIWVETTAAGGGGGGGTWTQQRFIASNAQVSFILGSTPASTTSIIVSVNGVKVDGSGVDYTVSGTTLTWLNNDFALEAGDVVSVTYII